MFIGDRLKSGFENIVDILCEEKIVELVKELYQKALASILDEDDFGEDSHNTLCIVVALCLLNDKDEIVYPLSMDDEEELLVAQIAEQVDFIMNVENLVEHNILTKNKDGQISISAVEKKKNETKKPIRAKRKNDAKNPK